MNKNQVSEGSSAKFSVAFFDPSGMPATPLQAYVTVYCRTTGTIVRPEAAATVTGPTLLVSVTNTENALVVADNTSEIRRIKVRATYGIGDEFVTLQDYVVSKALA